MADDSGVLSDSFALSSAFGTNYDGSIDTQDNGVGRWGANTRDPTLKGVALPEDVIRKNIGDPKDPAVKAAINSGEYQVEVVTDKGRTGLYPVVDMGPAPWTGKGIDITGGAARDLGLNENSYVHYQLRKKDASGSQQTKEEASPLAQLRLKYPQYANVTDEQLIDKIYGTDPKFKRIDSKQFSAWMKSPTGGKAIQDAIAKGETPIQKFRDKYPQYGTLTDEQVAIKLLPIVQKKEPQMTLEGLKDRMNPKPAEDNWALNWAKSIVDIGGESAKQLIPQSELVGMQAWRGVAEMEQTAIDRNLDTAFGFAYPDAQTTEQKQALYSKYYGIRGKDDAETQTLREEAFKADLFKQPGVNEKLQQLGLSPLQVVEQFDAGMNGLDHRKEMDKTVQWMNKVVGDIDRDNKGSLPQSQEQAAKLIAQAPATVLLNLFPGMRELGNYSMLYDANRKYLESKNPALGGDKIDQMARHMADAQFPAQEVLGLVLGRGGGVLTAGITNKILKAGAEVAVASGTGAGVFTSNQLIRNIGSGDDWTKDLGESAFEGSLLGGVGAGTRLTFNGIKTLLSTSRDGKAASGTLSAVESLTPKEANDFVAGGSNNGVSEKIDGTALDLGIDAVASHFAERAKSGDEELLPRGYSYVTDEQGKTWLQSPEGERFPGKQRPIGDVTSAAYDSLSQARMLRREGNNEEAEKKFNEALSLMDDAGRQKVADTVQQSVKAIAQKDPLPAKEKITGWQELKPWQTQADVPEGAETKIDPSGKTFWKAGADKTETSKQPDLTNFYGLENVPRGTEEVPPGALRFLPESPFESARRFKRMIGNIPGWHELEAKWNSIFAPERLSEEARITAQMGRGVAASEKVASTMRLHILAEQADLNSILKHGVESERRERYFKKYTNQEQADMISARQRGETVSDPIANKIFDFHREVYDAIGERAKLNGIKMGWLQNYYRQSLKEAKEADGFVGKTQKMWGKPGFSKTRHYPTLNDAIADGREPKTYNPERNLLAYDASVRSAIGKIQHLKKLESVGLAWEDSKKMPELAESWPRIETPDGKAYRVSPEQAQVLANEYNINSIYDTIAGPWATFAGALKGVTGLKLSFPMFHALHISTVDMANTLVSTIYRVKNRVLTGKELQDMLNSPVNWLTAPGLFGWKGKYGLLRDVMSGKASKSEMENMSDKEKTDMRDLAEIGIIPHISHERQMQWTEFIGRNRRLSAGSEIAKMGYNFITTKWFQRWWFQHVTPALKIGRALQMRDTALMMHPDLYSNHKKRALEFDKIQRDVEGRYGEMNYNNLMWNQMAKQIGISTFLSLGWNLGFWRIYGDAATDLTNNALHMDQIVSGASKQKEVVTERMLYAPIYSAMGAAVFLGASYMATGTIKSWLDGFFPRIGKKPNGDDDRLRTPWFTTEIASMAEHYKQYAGMGNDPVKGFVGGGSEYLLNKLNPALQDIYHAFVLNKDFRGTEISDHVLDWPTQQLPQKIMYVLKDLVTPIPAEPLISGTGMSDADKIAGFLGFSPAPQWTTRTALENEILDEYGAEAGKVSGKPQAIAQVTEAKKEYDEALKTGKGIQEAQVKLKALGVSDRAIHESQKNYRIPIANRLFKSLSTEAQKELLKRMNPSERAEFLPYTSKKARAEYERSLSQ